MKNEKHLDKKLILIIYTTLLVLLVLGAVAILKLNKNEGYGEESKNLEIENLIDDGTIKTDEIEIDELEGNLISQSQNETFNANYVSNIDLKELAEGLSNEYTELSEDEKNDLLKVGYSESKAYRDNSQNKYSEIWILKVSSEEEIFDAFTMLGNRLNDIQQDESIGNEIRNSINANAVIKSNLDIVIGIFSNNAENIEKTIDNNIEKLAGNDKKSKLKANALILKDENACEGKIIVEPNSNENVESINVLNNGILEKDEEDNKICLEFNKKSNSYEMDISLIGDISTYSVVINEKNNAKVYYHNIPVYITSNNSNKVPTNMRYGVINKEVSYIKANKGIIDNNNGTEEILLASNDDIYLAAGAISGSPAITAYGYIGGTVNASMSSLSPSNATVSSYQWYRNTEKSAVTGSKIAIGGANAATYIVTEADRNHYLYCAMTVSCSGYTTSTFYSPVIGPIGNKMSGSVTITGFCKSGQTLTAVPTVDQSGCTFSYSWRYTVNGAVKFSNASTSPTFLLTDEYVGASNVGVNVTVSKPGYSTLTLYGYTSITNGGTTVKASNYVGNYTNGIVEFDKLSEAISGTAANGTIAVKRNASETGNVMFNASKKVTLNLNGCTITSTLTGTDTQYVWPFISLNGGANLVIQDTSTGKTGTINVTGIKPVGIYVNKGTFQMDSGTITVKSSSSASTSVYGIYDYSAANNNSIIVNGGTINVTGTADKVEGITVRGSASIQNAIINASNTGSNEVRGINSASSKKIIIKNTQTTVSSSTGTSYGIYGTGELEINGGTTTCNTSASVAYGILNANNLITTKTNVKATSQTGLAVGILGGNKTISGGRIEVTSNSGDAIGFHSYSNGKGTSTLKDGYELIVTANKGKAYGVYQASGSGESYTLTGGTITAKASGIYSFGVFIDETTTGTMAINGTTITSTGTSSSCEAYGVNDNVLKNVAINITNANITATSIGSKNAYGIYSKSPIITSGGTVISNSSAGNATGIRCNVVSYNVSTTKTNITVTSQTGFTTGITGGNKTISGGRIEVTSNSGDAYGIDSFTSGKGTSTLKDSYELIVTANKGRAWAVYQRSGSGETFTLTGGTITTKASGAFSFGVYIQDSATGTMTINGTTITSTGTSSSCEACGVRNNVNKNEAINITNANITATSIGSKDAYGIYSYSPITTSGGTIISNSSAGKAYGIYGNFAICNISTTKTNVKATSQTGSAYGIQGGSKTISGGRIEATSNSGDAMGINSYNNVQGNSTLKDSYELIATAEKGRAWAIYQRSGSGETYTLTGGTITAKSSGAFSFGVYIQESTTGTMTINGTAITSTGTSNSCTAYGISSYSLKPITISNAKIDVTTTGKNTYGVYLQGAGARKSSINGISINSHSTSANTDVYGIYTSSNDELEITNSTTSITASTTQAKNAYGIMAYNKVTITGGTITGDAPSGWGYGLIQNNNSSQIIIGTTGGNPSQTDPCIIGTVNGVTSNGAKIYFYDGILKGKTNACSAPQYIIPELGYIPTNGTESPYKTLTLQSGATNAYVSLTETKGSNKTTKYYNYLDGAFQDVSNSSELASGTYSEIKLLKNITVTNEITIKNTSNIKFDLNNLKATFNLSNDSIIAMHQNGGTFEIIDNSSSKTGTIDVTGNVKSVNAIFMDNGTFKLTSGIIKATNSKGINTSVTNYTIGIKSTAGVINIAGGEINTSGNTNCVYGLEVGTSSTVNITNGKINVTGTGSKMTGVYLWSNESNKNSLLMSAGSIIVNNTGTGTDNKGIWANNANSTVNISSGTIDVNGSEATGIVRNGNLTLTGGTIKATSKSNTAFGITNFTSTTSGTINLNGSYKVEAKSESGTSYGVQIAGAEGARYTLTINKGNISSSSSTGSAYGIQLGTNANFTSQTIDGVTVSASTSKTSYGIYNVVSSANAVKVSNANITSTATGSGTSYGIYSNSPITTSGGTITSNSSAGTAYGVYSNSTIYNVSTTKTNVNVTSQTGSAYGIQGGNKTVSGGRIEVTSNSGDAIGINSFSTGSGTSTLKDNYELIVTANKGRAWAVYQRSGSGETFTLTGGTITAKASGAYSFGVFLQDSATGTMTINGTTITSTGTSDSCEACGVRNYVDNNIAINITNANITATSIGSKDAYGIRSQSPTITSGGTVTCNTSAGIAYGIRSNGLNYNLSTTKTNVKSTSQTGTAYGIIGGSRTISGGKIEVTANGGEAIGINSFTNGKGTTIIKDSYEIIAKGNRAYGINQVSGSGETFTINDGKITATATGTNFSAGVYIADSATGSTTVNLSSGTIIGRNGIYAKSPNSPLSINITGGNVNGVGAFAILTESGVQGNIKITNGQVTSDKVNAINIGEGGKVNLDISGGTIKSAPVATGDQNIYNAIHDYGTGAINVSGGTITGSFAGIGKYGTGNVVIGKEGDGVITTNPSISGESYGVYAQNGYKFYDGVLRGKTAAYYGNVIAKETNYDVNLETDGSYEKATLALAMGGSVKITGTNTVGQTLTADVSAVTPTESSFKYQWYYNSSNSTSNGAAISGETNKTYKIGSSLVNNYIYVVVTASKDGYASKTYVDITDATTNKTDKVVAANYSVGTNYFTTLAEAYSYIVGTSDASTTIKVEQNNTDASAFTVAAGKTITINTNGKTVTKTTASITNNGTLNITGTGTITSTLAQLISNTGTITVGDKTNGPTLQGGTNGILSTGNSGKITIENGTVRGNTAIDSTTGNITINNGHLIGTTNYGIRIKTPGTGTITMNGGDITTTSTANGDQNCITIDDNATTNITINNGTISAALGATAGTADGIQDRGTGSITINNGTIQGSNVGVNKKLSGNVTIKNGTISGDRSQAIYLYPDLPATNTLTIGEKGSATGPTIKGIKGNGITNDGSMKIELNSGTITASNHGIVLNGAAAVTVNGGSITSTSTSSTVDYAAIANYSSGKITINSGTITANSRAGAIYAGAASTGEIEITGGKLIGQTQGNADAIETDGSITIKISGGTLEGKQAGITSPGKTVNIDVTGGTISGGNLGAIWKEQGGNITISNNAILKATQSTIACSKSSSGNIVIKSNAQVTSDKISIKNESANAKIIVGESGSGVSITAPTIKGETYGIDSVNGFEFYDGIIMGKTAAINGDVNTKVTKKETNYGVQLGTKDGYQTATLVEANYSDGTNSYATLSEAFSKAATKSTITVLRNVDEDASNLATVAVGKELTLDLNGKTITSKYYTRKVTERWIHNSGILNLQDSKGEGKILFDLRGDLANREDQSNGDWTFLIGEGASSGSEITPTINAKSGTYEIITDNNHKVAVLRNYYNSIINITGGTYRTTVERNVENERVYAYGINSQWGTLNMSGGTVEAIYKGPSKDISYVSAIYKDGSINVSDIESVNITGGTLKSSGSGIYFHNMGSTTPESKLAISEKDGKVIISGDMYGILNDRKGSSSITIDGGTITGGTNAIYQTADCDITINNGSLLGKTGSAIYIPSGNFNLNINGGNITSTGSVQASDVIHLLNKSNVNVKVTGGEIVAGENCVQDAIDKDGGTGDIIIEGGRIEGYQCGIANQGTGNVLVKDGTIIATNYYAIYSHFTKNDVTIESGDIIGKSYGIFWSVDGNINVNGGRITSTTNSAIQLSGNNNITVKGGTITSTKAAAISASKNTNMTIESGELVSSCESGGGAIYTSSSYSGEIKILGGTIKGTTHADSDGMDIYGNANITVKGGNIYGEGHAAINYKGHGTIRIEGGNLEGERYGIRAYIPGGASSFPYTVSGDIVVTNGTINAKGSGISQETNGNVTVTGGTITSTNGIGIANNKNESIVTIGTENRAANVNSPSIKGATYGIDSVNGFKFYDGIIMGKTAAINGSISEKITAKEDGYRVAKSTKTIDGANYNSIYLAEILPANLMQRTAKEEYVIGAERAGKTQYTADLISSITLKDTLTFEETYAVSWDVSASEDGSVMAYLVSNGDKYDMYICGEGKIIAPSDCQYLFANYTNCKSIEGLDLLDTKANQVNHMGHMFDGCSSLLSVNVEKFDTQYTKSMSEMFKDCSSLTTIDISSWNKNNDTNTKLVTSMEGMFKGCSGLVSANIGDPDTSGLLDMHSMFNGCENLIEIDLNGLNTDKVTNMENLFLNCKKLQKVITVTTTSSGSTRGWNTASLQTVKNMFSGCASLTSVTISDSRKPWVTTKVTDFSGMFNGCASFTTLDLTALNTSAATTMEKMFYNCNKLKVILLGNDFSKIPENSVNFINSNTAIITPKTSEFTFGSGSTTVNAILYVPNLSAETSFENADTSSVFGTSRIRPILELIGEKEVVWALHDTYEDEGASVAGLTKEDSEYYKPNGTNKFDIVFGYTLTVDNQVNTEEKGEYKVIYTLSNASGEVMKAERIVSIREKPTIPTITVKQGSVVIPEGAWANGNVNITIDGSILYSGDLGYQYSYNNSVWSDYSEVLSYETDTNSITIYAKAIDKLNKNLQSDVVSREIKLDKILPKITSVDKTGYNEQYEVYHINANDPGDSCSGISQYGISKTENVADAKWQNGADYKVLENGDYYIWVKDAAGNVSSNYIKITANSRMKVEATIADTKEYFADTYTAISELSSRNVKEASLRLLEDDSTEQKIEQASGTNYKYDLNNHTLELIGDNATYVNRGTLKIINLPENVGTIKKSQTTSATNIFENYGTLTIDDDNIVITFNESGSGFGAIIANNENGTLNINGGTIKQYDGIAVSVNGGTVNVTSGDISNTSNNLFETTGGTLNITGKVTLKSNYNVISISNNATVNIGTQDATVDVDYPKISSNNSGIDIKGGTLNFYDGRISALASGYIKQSGGNLNVETNYHIKVEEKEGGMVDAYLASNETDYLLTWDISRVAGTDSVYAGLKVLTGDGRIENSTYALVVYGTGESKDFETARSTPWFETYKDKITALDLKEGVTSYGKNLFYGLPKVTTITLPQSLEKIYDYAFGSMDSVNGEVSIPNKVKEIGINPFTLTKVTGFNVGSENTVFKADNKVLINDTDKKIIAYPIGSANTTYTVPSDIKVIGAHAFNNANKIIKVYVKTDSPVTVEPDSTFINLAPNSIIYLESKSISETFTANKTYTTSTTQLYYPDTITVTEKEVQLKYGDVLSLNPTIEDGNYGSDVKYQWYKDGSIIPGATTATYSKNVTALDLEGEYVLEIKCALENGEYYYTVNSDVITVTISDKTGPDTIVTSTHYNEDGTATVTVTARDSESGIGDVLVNGTTLEDLEIIDERKSAKGSFDVDGKGEFEIKAKDKFGNETTTTITAYEITYEKNDDDATGTVERQIKISDTPLKLRDSGFEKEGFVIREWNTSSTGEGIIYNLGGIYTPNEDAHLYAIWDAKMYKVTFYNDDGINGEYIVSENEYPIGAEIEIPGIQERAAEEYSDLVYRVYYHYGWSGEKVDSNSSYEVQDILVNENQKIIMGDTDLIYRAKYTYKDIPINVATVIVDGEATIKGTDVGVNNIEGTVIIGENSVGDEKPTIEGEISLINRNGLILWYLGIVQGPIQGMVTQK